MTEEQQTEVDGALEKVEAISRHIENVRDNCLLIGKRLIADGEIRLGIQLIANGHIHDNSKFSGIEFLHLNVDATKTKLEIAALHHSATNAHHPEYWGDIQSVPRIFLAEMVADWGARAAEFGTSLRDWVDNGAPKRFGYEKGDKTYKAIMEFVNMLCDVPFKQK